jgi:hypothetical protein
MPFNIEKRYSIRNSINTIANSLGVSSKEYSLTTLSFDLEKSANITPEIALEALRQKK